MRGCQADASSDRCLQGRCRLPPHAPLPSPLLPACCRRFCTSQLYTRAMETCGIGRAGRLWVAAGICSNEWLLSRCGSAEDASHCVRRDPSCPAAGSRHSPLQDHAHTRQSTRNAPKNPVSSGNEPSGSCAPPVAPTHPGREPACPRIPSAPPQRQSTGPSPTRQVICPCPSIHPRLPPPPPTSVVVSWSLMYSCSHCTTASCRAHPASCVSSSACGERARGGAGGFHMGGAAVGRWLFLLLTGKLQCCRLQHMHDISDGQQCTTLRVDAAKQQNAGQAGCECIQHALHRGWQTAVQPRHRPLHTASRNSWWPDRQTPADPGTGREQQLSGTDLHMHP